MARSARAAVTRRAAGSLFPSNNHAACFGVLNPVSPKFLGALLGRELEAIADAQFGQEMRRTGRVGFELLPQPADKHSKVLYVLSVCRAPDLAQQLAVGQDFAGMDHQVAQ